MFKKRYVSIEIGDKRVKVVNGSLSNNTLEIYEYDIVPIPFNLINQGVILNVEKMREIIQNIFEKNKIKDKKLIFTITGSGVITRDLYIPKVNEQEMEKILSYEIRQYIPVELEQYSYDYKVLEEVENDEQHLYRVLVAAVPLRQIEKYMKLHEKLNMKIEAIDLPANSVRKYIFGKDSLKTKNENEQGDCATLGLGIETTGLYIFSNEKLMLNRILQMGFSIMNENAHEQQESNIVGLEEKKIFMDESNNLPKDDYNKILNEIGRFFEYYHSRNGQNKLSKIQIFGTGSKIEGIDTLISEYFSLPVEKVDSFYNLKYKGKKTIEQFNEDTPFLISCIGAIIRE